jgi:hypothetical protein
MHAAVIDLLSEKGRFSREQSLVLAEAIDMTIEKAQLVTVPILDARLAAINARVDKLEARMDSGFIQVNARIDMVEMKMERWAVRIIVSMLLSQAALGPIGLNALDALRRALSSVVP